MINDVIDEQMSKPAAVAAQSSVGPAASTSGPAALKSTQQHQALTSCCTPIAKITQQSKRASRWQLSSSVRPLLASASPAANTSGPAAQKSTQQYQALTSCAPTQAPSTSHRAKAGVSRWAQLSALKSGRLAGSRRFWLLAPGFMASGRFCLVPHRPPKFLGLRRNRDGRWECTVYRQEDHPPPRTLPPGRGAEQVV